MSTQTAQTLPKSGSPDYALLLQQLERRLLTQSESEQAVQILTRESIWQTLPNEEARQWARLAQIAGLADLSLRILGWITERNPDFVQAWQDRVELLETLGRKDNADATPERVAGTPVHDSSDDTADSLPASAPSKDDGAPWEETIETPFAAMRTREAALQRFLELFCGREDCFARQWADRESGTQGYIPVRRPLTNADVLDHLRGHKTYGIYLLQQDSKVKLAVVDADLVSRLRTGKVTSQDRDLLSREKRFLLTRLPEISREQGLPCLVEFSGGKGFHFWYLFAEPVPALEARQVLQSVVKRIASDLCCFNLEVFPKQDKLAGKGLGNLVKLPLGIHRLTGRPSHFLHVADRSPWVQLEILAKVRLIRGESLSKVSLARARGEVIVHPREEQWAKEYPELALLGERCTALGQIFVGCRQTRTLSLREERVLLGTIGFLPRARTLLHHLFQELPEYNPHLVDYRLSRVRGSPLGCKRIHSLLNLVVDQCPFPRGAAYEHPLLHWPDWTESTVDAKAERVTNLRDALARLQDAIDVVERFLGDSPANQFTSFTGDSSEDGISNGEPQNIEGNRCG
jgi:hypothetical protein